MREKRANTRSEMLCDSLDENESESRDRLRVSSVEGLVERGSKAQWFEADEY
jgi:hypothetical protein